MKSLIWRIGSILLAKTKTESLSPICTKNFLDHKALSGAGRLDNLASKFVNKLPESQSDYK